MKTTRLLILMLCVATAAQAQVGSSDDVLSDLVKPFAAGDAKTLAVYFAPSIDFDILGKENVYSKQQATQVLQGFFDNNTPKSFSIRHRGGKDVMKYAVYSLVSTDAKKFRVTIFVKTEEKLIRQVRIETEQ